MNPHALIAIVASALLGALAALATVATYRVAPAFLLPLLWLPYFLRRRLRLHAVHYGLFAAALLLHSLGGFGFYQRSFAGLAFDIYVHFYFAFAVALVSERFFRHALPGRAWVARGATLMVMMGFGALHEIMEYGSYLLLGEERGMLKPSASYRFDTQRDLLNNLLGTLTALLLVAIVRTVRRAPGGEQSADAADALQESSSRVAGHRR